jgi:uncharacterized protein (DUF2062 family)
MRIMRVFNRRIYFFTNRYLWSSAAVAAVAAVAASGSASACNE